jgi:signal transduction histidine kinase
VFSGASFPGAGQELEAAFAGAERRFEHRLARRGAGRRQVEAVYRPHRASDGSVLGVVTLLTDITERKRMELRLAQQGRDLLRSNEELEQFAYVASHDLKAPLRGIENLVSWIEEDMEEMLTGDTRINMDLLKSRVRRLESLLDDLLAYSRAGRNDATVDTIDTRVLVQELAALVSPPEGFQIEADAGLPTIEAARAPLTQALQNLIGNAIKHHDHPATGHIWVAARPTGAMIAFTVTDDGPGIPEQFRERVFGMFQTLRPRDEVEGSGMGLAIVKKLVERQGGTVWLSEGRDDRGLTVHFTWPVGVAQGSTDGTNRELAAG